MAEGSETLIPKQSDTAANRANVLSIDRAVGESRYVFIVAWGKFLGSHPRRSAGDRKS